LEVLALTSEPVMVDKTINIQEIENEFTQLSHVYKQLEEEGKHILEIALEQEHIKKHTVSSRVKEKDSFLKKVERKEISKPFEEITDIVGLRVVCLFLSDIEKIKKVINDNFTLISEDNKITDTTNPNLFGYMSAHYIVKIKDEFTGFRYDSIKNIPFEIQVRTISMDAWANISHFLEYKSESDIPKELKRDFNALSGLFYVADTHFEMFYKERQKNTMELTDTIKNIVKKSDSYLDTPLNLDSLTLYLANKFPDRGQANSTTKSYLVTELTTAGYNTIRYLDNQLDRSIKAFLKYESEKYPDRKFLDTGVVRISLAILDKDFRKLIYPNDKHEIYLEYEKLIEN